VGSNQRDKLVVQMEPKGSVMICEETMTNIYRLIQQYKSMFFPVAVEQSNTTVFNQKHISKRFVGYSEYLVSFFQVGRAVYQLKTV
jgi:hypothetical protein